MINKIKLGQLFVFLGLLLIQQSVISQNLYNHLVWSDEFNYVGSPDSLKWTYDIGNGCPKNCGWGNQELESYTNRMQNVYVQNGVLKITAIKEKFNGSDYTSARILTKGKFSFKYGRVEVMAKVPAEVGTWPAIWMLGNNIDTTNWPACGEIDIMEHRGRDINKIFGTLHYPGHYGDKGNGNTKIISNATTEFHKYTLEWTPTSIKLFIDNQLLHSVANSEGIPFNQNFFLILNMAMGGGFAGPVDPAFSNASMEVDYIRVYQ
ncbi:MAG: glycoside hydrolase family 16 protein [Ginsengibacter sp.]|jgi:beta-glucanase (GH16 family)